MRTLSSSLCCNFMNVLPQNERIFIFFYHQSSFIRHLIINIETGCTERKKHWDVSAVFFKIFLEKWNRGSKLGKTKIGQLWTTRSKIVAKWSKMKQTWATLVSVLRDFWALMPNICSAFHEATCIQRFSKSI